MNSPDARLRPHFVFLLAAVGTIACADPPARDLAQPPNVVLILADDMGYETLGANGGTSYDTPNLDALAESGMRFTHAYSTPLCTPSRVQIMTGKYNFRNYVGYGVLDPSQRTFAHLLKETGYATAIAGKWQLYGNPEQQKRAGQTGALPAEAGFGEHYLWWVEKRAPRYKNPYLVLGDLPPRTYHGAYGPDIMADALIDFITRHRSKPFFAYYPMILPHAPFQPPPNHADYASFDPNSRVSNSTYFRSQVEYLDDIVGRLVESLEELGLRKKTLVLFTSDNGSDQEVVSHFGDREIRGGKGYPTAAGTHVPMIASWPGTIEPRQMNDNLIDFTDFLPTLADLAGVTLPAAFQADGLSFYPQLIGEAGAVRSWIFCHYAPQYLDFEPRRYVQDREWKLYDDGAFFNIAEDPEELHPLEASSLPERGRQVKEEFLTVLARYAKP